MIGCAPCVLASRRKDGITAYCRLNRLFLMASVALFLFPILISCAPSPVPPPNVTTIVFLTDLANYYRPLADEFHRGNPDILVQVRDIHTLTPDPIKNWNRQVAAAADVVPIGGNGIELYDALRGKLLYNLRPFLDRDPELAASFVPTALDCLTWNGSIYGLPQTFSVPLMVYNRSLFDAHGVPIRRTVGRGKSGCSPLRL